MLLYDGGWRVFNGIKPHADFYSPLGPITYLYVALGYFLFGANVNSLAYLQAVSLPIFMVIIWFSLKTRLSPFWLFWAALLVGLCLVAQHPLRLPYWNISYAMIYNRLGYSFLMFFVLLLFSPQGDASRVRLKINSFQIGALFSLLFFIKISYLIGACPFFLAFILLRKKAGMSWLFISLGFGITTFVLLAYLKFDIRSVIRDLSVTGAARTHAFNTAQIAVDLILIKYPLLLGLALTLLSSLLYFRSLFDNLILWGAVVVSSVAIQETNCPIGTVDELPLIPLLFILLSSSPADVPLRNSEILLTITRKQSTLVWLIVVLSSLNFYILTDAASILYSANRPIVLMTWPRFSEPSMSDLIMLDNNSHPNFSYSDKINDGLRLLKENHLDNLRSVAWDFTSPFAFALKASPPIGFPTFWQSNFNISKISHPDENKIFRGLDVILMPKLSEDEDTTTLMTETYKVYLKNHFIPIAESNYWTVLKRR